MPSPRHVLRVPTFLVIISASVPEGQQVVSAAPLATPCIVVPRCRSDWSSRLPQPPITEPSRTMRFSLRQLRLRAVWLLVLPFLAFARPTSAILMVGAGLALTGAVLRAWAAGTIRKERELSTAGPYAYTRNPLYLGSFLIGLGFTLAGGRPTFVLLFIIFFAWIYGRSIRAEARLLNKRFGEQYAEYASNVPVFVPRVIPFRAAGDGRSTSAGGFRLERWWRNREYEALLGVLAGFMFLVAKLLW